VRSPVAREVRWPVVSGHSIFVEVRWPARMARVVVAEERARVARVLVAEERVVVAEERARVARVVVAEERWPPTRGRRWQVPSRVTPQSTVSYGFERYARVITLRPNELFGPFFCDGPSSMSY
jgi:hypothetical protein